MLAPAADSPPPYRSSVEVKSISNSPERARALPESMSGIAAGLSEYSRDDDDDDDDDGCC